jgi:neuronal cell adhesion protein
MDDSKEWRHLLVLVAVTLGCLVVGSTGSGKVTTAPHIFEQSTEFEMAYRPLEDVRLPCVADTDSQPTYAWKKNDQPLALDDGHVIKQPHDGTILIKSATEADDGVYQCFASNQYGTAVSSKTALKRAVILPFKTIVTPDVHSIEVGRSLTLRCTPPESYPKGSVYWGISRPGSTRLQAIETNDRVLLDYEGHLRIANVIGTDDQFDESVSYLCIVYNPLLGAFVQGDDQKIRPQAGTPSPRPPAIMWTSPVRDVALKGRNKKINETLNATCARRSSGGHACLSIGSSSQKKRSTQVPISIGEHGG